MAEPKNIFLQFVEEVDEKGNTISAIERLLPKYSVKEYKLEEITPEKAFEYFSTIQEK